ncbi:hypothetical protein Q2T83_07670 [Fervidibacter sacchari]|uniref:Uncharacterized protein n=1 Tax=Candidatus Fervidibacter sacchari TaxID=1448929 RepID=A0ABT2ENT5_9BACT|nr:hypothetical protein [Candidatus Fervidibacter sacchari]MCS3918550.1 hypothetical protein [Candidatus Fervidibacter sacchari]WKU17689.1 hypothetical protein Q2T83_07670 [Candidatus Fervidibacter sacchari]
MVIRKRQRIISSEQRIRSFATIICCHLTSRYSLFINRRHFAIRYSPFAVVLPIAIRYSPITAILVGAP